MKTGRESWSFSDYIEEIISLSEVSEIPGIEETRAALIKEVKARYPNESKMLVEAGNKAGRLH